MGSGQIENDVRSFGAGSTISFLDKEQSLE